MNLHTHLATCQKCFKQKEYPRLCNQGAIEAMKDIKAGESWESLKKK